MKRDITRAIIDATVDRGLRDIYEDPRRSIRKLADLGRQFQKARFMQNIYDLFQDLLRNDDSPYYTAIEHLLQYTDRKKLKDLGINMGYNSFTKGAKQIRKYEAKDSLTVPWNLIIRMNSSSRTGMTPHDLMNVIAQGKKLGIYSYTIILENDLFYLEDLLKLFITYDDCAFILFLPDDEIDDSLSSYISECSNVLYLLPIYDDSCGANVVFLKRFKAWYGLYTYYDCTNASESFTSSASWDYVIHDSAFLLSIAKDGTPLDVIMKAGEEIKGLRLEPIAPLFIFDLYADTMSIQKLIRAKSCFFEINSDGSFHTDKGDFPGDEGIPDIERAFRNYL